MPAASAPEGAAAPSGHVYCTLVMTDSYLPGACVLAHSLRDAGTQKKLAVLITPETLSEESIAGLRELYDYVIPVDRTANPHPANLQILARPDLLYTFTKIELWNQTQFSKIVYLDADVVALQAPDELFDLSVDFAAAPDVGWPDAFNSGVMVLKPDTVRYNELIQMALAGESFDGADQGLLNQYFDTKGWHRISFAYNCTPNAEYQWEPAFRHYRRNIKLVHFIGRHKPWNMTNVTGGSAVYRELLSHWFAVRDRHSGSWQAWAKAGSRSAMSGFSFSGPAAHIANAGSSWNPSVSAPPMNSRPEAANLPNQIYYSFAGPSSQAKFDRAFVPPRSYPPPPKNLGFDLPSKEAGAPPTAIFPWEFKAQTEKPSRVFEDVASIQSDDETVASALSEAEDEPTSFDQGPTAEEAEALSELIVEAEAAPAPEAEPQSKEEAVPTPALARGRSRGRAESVPMEHGNAGHYHNMTGLSFRPELNAWDADPVIRRYMHTIMARRQVQHTQVQSSGPNQSDLKGFLPSYPSYKHVTSSRSIPDLKSPPSAESADGAVEGDDVDEVERDELQPEGSVGELEEMEADLKELPLRSYDESGPADGQSRSVSESRSVADSVSNMTVVGEDRKTERTETARVSQPALSELEG